jgi:Fe-S-cluster containining protein
MAMFGIECQNYDEENKFCEIYENRPEICRAKHAMGEDFTEKCCEYLREQRNVRVQRELQTSLN